MLSQLRSAAGPLKRGLAAPLARAGISPNAVTLSAIPLSLAAAALAWTGHYWLGLAVGLPATLADFVDGAVAEISGKSSPEGNFLEAVVDRVVEGLLLAGMARVLPFACMLALTFSFTISYIKARVGLVLVADNSDWPGWGDRTDRLALVGASYLAAGFHLVWGERVLWLLIGLAFVGMLQRLRHALGLVTQAKQDGNLLPYLQ